MFISITPVFPMSGKSVVKPVGMVFAHCNWSDRKEAELYESAPPATTT